MSRERMLNTVLISIALYLLISDGVFSLKPDKSLVKLQEFIAELDETGVTHDMQVIFERLLQVRHKTLAACAETETAEA